MEVDQWYVHELQGGQLGSSCILDSSRSQPMGLRRATTMRPASDQFSLSGYTTTHTIASPALNPNTVTNCWSLGASTGHFYESAGAIRLCPSVHQARVSD